MATKKVSYAKLLKEALSTEWDTSKTVDTKGPMLDPILSYSGEGELETNKDAASILERYYFAEEKEEKLIDVNEAEENEIDEDPQKKKIPQTKKDIEDEIDDGEAGSLKVTKESEEEEVEDEEVEDKDEEVEESLNMIDNLEKTVLRKLTSEMEEAGKEDKEEELDVDEEVDEEVKESAAIPQRMSGLGTGAQRDELKEVFQIFKEQIEEEDEPEEETAEVEESTNIDSRKIRV